jgi:hypothetical protein
MTDPQSDGADFLVYDIHAGRVERVPIRWSERPELLQLWRQGGGVIAGVMEIIPWPADSLTASPEPQTD